LGVVEGLCGLLHAGVQITDDRLRPTDGLPFELKVESEHTVCRWMLWAHVDDLALVGEHVRFPQEVVVDRYP
jgi:hypothetical protein